MSLLAKLTPTNLASEKAKFSSDYNYNPQFIYAEPILPAKLQKYGQTKPAMVQLAQAYLAAHPLPTASSPEDTTPITANQVQQEVLALCQRLRIKPPQIIFSNQLITRFVVLQDKLITGRAAAWTCRPWPDGPGRPGRPDRPGRPRERRRGPRRIASRRQIGRASCRERV